MWLLAGCGILGWCELGIISCSNLSVVSKCNSQHAGKKILLCVYLVALAKSCDALFYRGGYSRTNYVGSKEKSLG